MKKVTSLLMLMLLCFGITWGQVTVTVGTGTATSANFPVASTYAYTYTQQIYTQAQINTEGTITKIRFYHATGSMTANSESWTVYMGHTTKNNFNNTTAWEAFANLTQVFTGTVTSPGAGNWVEITLDSPFYYNNLNNLIVAVDENSAGSDTFAWGSFTSANNTGIYVRGTNNINPSSPGTASGRNAAINRIQFDITLPNVLNPVSFGSAALNGYKIYLGWTKNANANDVIIASNTSNSFGTPVNGTSYNVDDMIGTAKVIYKGDATFFINSGLNPSTAYYYKIWSVDGSIEYSSGKTTNATTRCATATELSQAFTATTFPPTCWTNVLVDSDAYPTGTTWNRTAVSQNGTARAYFYNDTYYSIFDLNTLEFNVAKPVLKFRHAYATYAGELDALQIGYTNDGGESWWEMAWLDGGSSGPLVTAPATTSSFVPTTSQWAWKSLTIPVQGAVMVKFRAHSSYGNNLYLDDISVVSGVGVSGTVTSSLTGLPIAGARVVFGGITSFITGADGTYSAWMEAGTYSVACYAAGFNPASQAGVVISEGSVVDFALANPTMDIDPLAITEDVVYGTTGTKELTITNNGNGPLAYELEAQLLRSDKGMNLEPAITFPELRKNEMLENIPQDASLRFKSREKAMHQTDAYTTCPDGSVFSTEPDIDSWGVVTSEASPGYSVFQYFKGASAPIDGISFWGGNLVYNTAWSACGTEDPMTFAIKFYADDNGLPGALVASFTKSINRLSTGIPLSTYGDMYFYTTSFDEEIDLPRGWVSVVGQTSPTDCWFMWAASTSLTDVPYLQWSGTSFGQGDYAVAMCLNGGGTWLTSDEYAGTVLPGQTKTLTLSLDGNYSPGAYNASMKFYSDPYVGITTVPVTMNILSPVSGTVTVANTGMLAANAQVIYDGYSPVFTGGDGSYSVNVFPGNYEVTVIVDGYCPYVVTDVLIEGVDVVQDFNIQFIAPTFTIAPNPVLQDIDYGNITSTSEVTVTNNGPCDGSFSVSESSAWLSVSPAGGAIPAGGSATLTLTYDPAGLDYGNHETTLDFDFAGASFQSVNVTLNVAQEVQIPEPNAWGGVSTYVNLNAKGPASMETLLADILDSMVILVGEEGFFWPAQNINTFPGGAWNNHFGYKLKMAGDDQLFFYGDPVPDNDKTITFTPGVHIIPVLSNAPVSAQCLFAGKPIEFAFGYDGSIYWPNGGIYTLNTLLPGFAYLVRFNATTTLNYANCKGGELQNNPPSFANVTTWNNVTRTGDIHTIGISTEACAELLPGDVIGVFNQNGLCTGMAQYFGNNQSFAVIAYGDDPTTSENDGLTNAEPLTIKIFRNGEVKTLNPVYNTKMPNADGVFANDGLSQITVLKVGALSIGENELNNVSIYPNPSTGVFNINMSKISNPIEMSVSNSHGQVIYTSKLNGSQKLDLSSQPSGVYFVRLIGEKSIKLEKLVIE